MDLDVVIFGTDPSTLIRANTLLVTVELARRCESHLVVRGIPVERVLQRTQPRLVITSWRDIGPRVLDAVHEFSPHSVVWVVSSEDPAAIRKDAHHPIEQIFDEHQFMGHSGLPLAVKGFLQRPPSGAVRPSSR